MRQCIMLVPFFLSPFFLTTQRGLDIYSIYFLNLDRHMHLIFNYLHLILDTVVVYSFNSVFNIELYLIKLYFTVQNSSTMYKDQFQSIQSFSHKIIQIKIQFAEKSQNARIHH